ncbi:hypothetical protein BX070DRAFT_219076 [Coemansia spiralis]|nr:hypothetical protein BX070DRAFT_219076 [Coemansia spiralis]
MPVCQYFLQNKCSFGDRCRNEHPQTRASAFGQSSSQAIMQGGGASSNSSAFGLGNTNRFGALATTSAFGQKQPQAFSGFGAFASTANQQSGQMESDDPLKEKKPLDAMNLKELISDRPGWKLSCFGPLAGRPSLLTETDVSPEEVRLEFAMAQQASGGSALMCQQNYDRMVAEADSKLNSIAGNAGLFASQWQQQHGPDGGAQSTFGQPKSAFGQSAFGGGAIGQQKPVGSSAFGDSVNTTQPGSAFGGGLGSSNIGQSAFGLSNSTTSAFGSSNLAQSAFGLSNPVPSAFGGPTTAASAFGGSTTATSAFGGSNPAASAFGSSNSTTSAFGKSAFGTSSAFSTAANNRGGFAATAEAPISMSSQDIAEIAGPPRELTADEISNFKAPRFVRGAIPEVPPTPELCSH